MKERAFLEVTREELRGRAMSLAGKETETFTEKDIEEAFDVLTLEGKWSSAGLVMELLPK